VLREVSILKQLPKHPNVVRLLDVYEPTKNISTCSDLYLAFKKSDLDLLQQIQSEMAVQE